MTAAMAHLEQKLEEHQDKRVRMIVTDGVFSMDGDLAPMDKIVELGEKYDAMVFVDECHSSGFIGKTGRGTHEHFGVMGKIDIITTTYGKALGGATGGCVSGRKEVVELCRQRARPYLFSNSIAPPIIQASLKVLEILSATTERRDRLEENTKFWRQGLTEAGFVIKDGESPIVPIMLFNAKLSQDFARDLYGRARGTGAHSHAALRRSRHPDPRERARFLQEGRRETRCPRSQQEGDRRQVRSLIASLSRDGPGC